MSEDGQEAEGRKTLTEKLGGTTDEQLLAEFTGADAENLSYDFFKNMTSLSVLTLGGILTLSEGLFAERIEFRQMMLTAGLIAAGGVVALQCQADIVQMARGKKVSAAWLRFGHRIVPGFLGAGIGSFLALIAGAFG
ncbi:hypothetical protein GRI38_03520 [Altererythrobacter aurantiacus]|uniref:Uncharacterized protein n=1 Tax=Parapontixanthobacter aurantiacus TaxID=1463599 RepID=A0A844ZAZ9_9SPHN|nr:hypothetical protein [Parapontixanthobacter aurantiacus]MXO85095.1 hypothetical protein [Parapontixanthobacter aurantiacus]